MPNWVTNKGIITGDKETIDKIFDLITSDDNQFDFNRIIPEPLCKEDCNHKYYKTDNDLIQVDNDRPWFNWYDWHCDNWGTKWNSCDAYICRSLDTGIGVLFDTAWSFPEPIWRKLAHMFPTATFDIKFADEDLGNNCGYFRAECGNIDLQWVDTLDFACDVLGYSKENLADWGYDV